MSLDGDGHRPTNNAFNQTAICRTDTCRRYCYWITPPASCVWNIKLGRTFDGARCSLLMTLQSTQKKTYNIIVTLHICMKPDRMSSILPPSSRVHCKCRDDTTGLSKEGNTNVNEKERAATMHPQRM